MQSKQHGFGEQMETGYIRFNASDLVSGSTAPAEVLTDVFRGMSYDLNDDSIWCSFMPDDWMPDTDMTAHVVWCVDEDYATGNGEVRFTLQYESVDTAQLIGGGTTATLDSEDINIPAAQDTMVDTAIGAIDADDLAAGDLLGFQFIRIALDGGADPTADLEVYQIYLEYTRLFTTYNR